MSEKLTTAEQLMINAATSENDACALIAEDLHAAGGDAMTISAAIRDRCFVDDLPTDDHVLAWCKPGRDAATCRYLTMTGHGWSCEKFGPARALLDRRAAAGEMHAQSDNCGGRRSR